MKHSSDICEKVSERLYFLRHLKRPKCTIQRPFSFFFCYFYLPSYYKEYTCEVYQNNLPQYLSDELDLVQTRCQFSVLENGH